MQRTETIWTISKEGHMRIFPTKFGKNPVYSLTIFFVAIVITSATSEELDSHAHMHSLIRALTACMHKVWM